MTKESADRPEKRGEHRFVLRLPARTGYLTVVRELVAAAAREHGFPSGEVARTVMAVDEACVNIVEHAYRGQAGRGKRLLDVIVEADPTRLVVTLTDRAAAAFSPLDHPVPDLAAYWTSEKRLGLGILILRQFMDHVSHSYHPGRGNTLRLVKYASWAQAIAPS